MKTIRVKIQILFFTLTLMLICSFNSTNIFPGELTIGNKAPKPDLKLQNISGKMISLNNIKKENGLLVIFSSNTCSFVDINNDRYPILTSLCKEKGIGIVAVNSNEAYRNKGESLNDMRRFAISNHYSFYYVLDKKNELADAFGATRVPHVFLFNKGLTLVYRGAIDSNAKYYIKNVKTHFLQNAIINMISGEKIEPNTSVAVGCSIKRL